MSTRSPLLMERRLARALLSTVNVTLEALSVLPLELDELEELDGRTTRVPVDSSADTTTALILPLAAWLLPDMLPVALPEALLPEVLLPVVESVALELPSFR